jgi:transposase-like protein
MSSESVVKIKRVAVELPCPRCGSRATVALMRPIFAWGVKGGSSEHDGFECPDCRHAWQAAS